MRWVYVAGPYTKGDVVVNVQEIIRVAEEVLKVGLCPIIPHLTHLWHLVSPHEYDYWIRYDNMLLRRCDCLLRVAGESSGADAEVALAVELDLPVYFSLADLFIKETS